MKKLIKHPAFFILSILISVLTVSVAIAFLFTEEFSITLLFLQVVAGVIFISVAYKSFKMITISEDNENYINSLTQAEKLELVEKDLEYIKTLGYHVSTELLLFRSDNDLKKILTRYKEVISFNHPDLLVINTRFHECVISKKNPSKQTFTQKEQI